MDTHDSWNSQADVRVGMFGSGLMGGKLGTIFARAEIAYRIERFKFRG